MKEFDYIIIGGGCAGLSLAYELEVYDKLKDKTLAIIEPRENYKNSGKIYVSNIEKTLETFLSIFDLIKLSLSNINNDDIEHDHLLISEEINLDERI